MIKNKNKLIFILTSFLVLGSVFSSYAKTNLFSSASDSVWPSVFGGIHKDFVRMIGGPPRDGLLLYVRDTTDTIGVSAKTQPAISPTTSIYYVSPTGSNTSPYDTWDKAANLPHTAITHAGSNAAGPHTVFISPGDYNSYLALVGLANLNGIKVVGVADVGSTDSATVGQVTLSYAGKMIYGSATGCLVANISVRSLASGKCIDISGGSFELSNLVASDAVDNALLAVSDGDVVVNNCLLEGCDYGYAIYISGSSNVDINYTRILNSTDNYCGVYNSLRHDGSGVVNVVNSVVMGCYGSGTLRSSGTGTLNVFNSIIAAGAGGGYPLKRDSGTINATNNIFIPGWTSDHNMFSGTIATDTDNIKTSIPDIVSHQRTGYLTLRIDDLYDAARLPYVESLETLFTSKGVKGTWAIDANSITEDNLADLQAMAARGVIDFCSHTFSHANLALSGSVFSVTKTGFTVDVDRTADTIVIDGATTSTVTGFKGKRVSEIRTELVAAGCTLGSLPTGVSGDSYGEIFADSSGPQSSGYSLQLLIDDTATTGFYYIELKYAKEVIENQLGVSVSCLAPPWGESNEDAETAAKNAGYLASAHAGSGYLLSDVNMFDMRYLSIPNDEILGDTDEETIQYTQNLCEMTAQYGGAFALVAHNTEEATVADWEIIIDAIISHGGVDIVSMTELIDNITSSGDWETIDSGVSYQRSWQDNGNYRLGADSIAINNGVDPFSNGDGDQYDADGYMVWSDTFDSSVYHWRNGVDIGAYAYGGGAKVKNSPSIISGSSMADYVLEFPVCPTLYDADAGVYTGTVPNQIDLSTFTDTTKMRWGSKGGVVYDSAQDAETIIAIDKAIGNGPPKEGLLLYAKGTTDTIGVSTLADRSGNGYDVSVFSYCPTLAGTEVLTLAHLTGSETVLTSYGTSTPTVTVGQITFDAGTIQYILLSDDTELIFDGLDGSSSDTIYNVDKTGRHGTFASAVTFDTEINSSYLAKYGGLKAENLYTFSEDLSEWTEQTVTVDGNTVVSTSTNASLFREEYIDVVVGDTITFAYLMKHVSGPNVGDGTDYKTQKLGTAGINEVVNSNITLPTGTADYITKTFTITSDGDIGLRIRSLAPIGQSWQVFHAISAKSATLPDYHATFENNAPLQIIPFNADPFPHKGVTDKIVCLGDSLTYERYVLQLARLYPDAEIIDAGVGGDKTSDMVARYQTDVLDQNPDYILYFGAVNSITAGESVASIESDIDYIVDNANAPIIIGTPTPWGNYATWSEARQTTTETIRDYVLGYDTSKVLGIVDLYTPLLDPGTDNLLAAYDSSDGLHFNPTGGLVVAKGFSYKLKLLDNQTSFTTPFNAHLDIFSVKLPEVAPLISFGLPWFSGGTAQYVDLATRPLNTDDDEYKGSKAFLMYAPALTGNNITKAENYVD